MPVSLHGWIVGAMSLSMLWLVGCGRPPRPQAPATQAIDSTSEQVDLSGMTDLSFVSTDYPMWRNADQNSVEPDRDVPTEWSAESGLAWSTDVPGRGHSSPIVVGQQVFLTTADDRAQTQSVVAYDLQTGHQQWVAQCHAGNLPNVHRKNSHASATPASDGSHVFAAFIHGQGLYVTALDLEGHQLWQTEVGPFASEHGYGASVTLWKGLVLVNGDSAGNGYEAALHGDSGAIVWRTPRPGVGQHGSYASPIVAELAGRTQLVQSGLGRVASYDPLTGEELWSCRGPAEVTANTLAFKDPYVIVSGGYPDKEILCIRADGSGDVTDSHIVWRNSRNVAYVPSPVVVGEKLYCVTDNGVAACFALSDGKMLWQHRLGGAFSASPLVIGKRFYIPNEGGEVHVFEIDPEFKELAVNRLSDEGGMASIVVSGNQLLIRTEHKLFCIGTPQKVAMQR